MIAAAGTMQRPGVLGRAFGAAKALALGTLLSMAAVTSLIPLGWLMRRMRAQALRAAGLEAPAPGWVLGEAGSGRVSRLAGGLAANIREGVLAFASLGLAVFPFAVIWLLSWWAGWENSFSKGYEQAFVGPSLGLAGVVVFCLTMVWLPMALAHQAVENRALALFEWRRVRSVVRHTRWGYVALSVATVILALPLFAGRGLVVFASDIIPGFDGMSAAEAAGLAGTIALVKAAYAFAALAVLRGWAGRIYARAVGRALEGPEAGLWAGSPLAAGTRGGARSWRLTHWMRGGLLAAIWFGLAAQVYVGQFLNHDWHMWLTHPMWLLPWPG